MSLAIGRGKPPQGGFCRDKSKAETPQGGGYSGRRNGPLPERCALFQVGDLREVLVAVVEILAAHAPDECVVVRGGGAVDRPSIE